MKKKSNCFFNSCGHTLDVMPTNHGKAPFKLLVNLIKVSLDVKWGLQVSNYLICKPKLSSECYWALCYSAPPACQVRITLWEQYLITCNYSKLQDNLIWSNLIFPRHVTTDVWFNNVHVFPLTRAKNTWRQKDEKFIVVCAHLLISLHLTPVLIHTISCWNILWFLTTEGFHNRIYKY